MLSGSAAGAQTITQIIDAAGDGTHILDGASGIAVEPAVEGAGNVYVTGNYSDNVFKIARHGSRTEIIDGTGDGTHGLDAATSIAMDASGNVYVTGYISGNAFKITPDGTINEIIDANGDGTHGLSGPRRIAVDTSGNVYVVGGFSHNAFKITPGGAITQIIDANGDGTHGLSYPWGIAADASGNVYLTGRSSNNAFKITPGGTITQIIDSTGDGTHNLISPRDIAVDASGNVYLPGSFSHNAFKITPGGTISEIIDATGDGTHGLSGGWGLAVEASGNVYVTGAYSDNAFKITPDGTIVEIIDANGDGTYGLYHPRGIAVEGSGIVYVVGWTSRNAFRITPQGMALSGVAGLIVPGFEVAVDEEGPTTFYAVRNTSGQEFLGLVDFYGVSSTAPLSRDPFILGPQATLTRNVRTDLFRLGIGDGLETGFIVVTEFDGTTAPDLEGDYFQVDDGNDFATGDRLVRPKDFCLQQEVRFVDFGSGSKLRILLNRPRGDEVPSFSYTAYNEAGTMVASGDYSTFDYLTVLDIGELVVGNNFGTVLFDFSSSGGGWVCAKYSAFGRFSVELGSACRDD